MVTEAPPLKQSRSPEQTVSADHSRALAVSPTWAEISARAFELYLARGRFDGHDVDDWLMAERELRELKSTGVTNTQRED